MSLYYEDSLFSSPMVQQAQRKLDKAEKALAKVEECLKPVEQPTDQESISDEERFMFRKLGLRMKAFLLLGNIFSICRKWINNN